jgi:two-component system, sensor histidine kinase and response regulator
MKKILVIEDEEDLRLELLTVLDFEGYEAIGAPNGRLGVQSAQKHLPQLIICDISMPELDGFGVITELRQDPQTAAIPVVFLSAQTAEAAIQRGMQLGAAGYLTKPYALDHFLATVKKFMHPDSFQEKSASVG